LPFPSVKASSTSIARCAAFKTMTKRLDSIEIKSRRSALDVILLGMLFEEPMYAYRMQKLIKLRGMDVVVNVRHMASIYQTLARLLCFGLIGIHETAQADASRKRTVYEITDRGREIMVAWLPRMVTIVAAGSPEFPTAVSVLTWLSRDVALLQFRLRAEALRKELSRLDAESLDTREIPGRILLGYRTAMLAAEHAWIQTLIADLSNGAGVWATEGA
jgi:DNA-binding PadR family transcriptional regulator